MKKIFLLTFCVSVFALTQDSVDVVFRFRPTGSATRVYVPGEFNAWANNTSGVISPGNTNAAMAYDGGSGTWYRTLRLRIAPTGGAIAGAYQYKFNVNGASDGWTNDPLNQRINTNDNSNSILYVKDPTIYQLLPNQRQAVIKTSVPIISAYIFPKLGASVDTSTISVTIDNVAFPHIGSYYDSASQQLQYPLKDPLTNGNHTAILTVSSSAGASNADTVTFTIQAGFVQITSQGGYSTYNPVKTIRGSLEDTSIHQVKLIRNNVDTVSISVVAGNYSISDSLKEGLNIFKAIVDTNGTIVTSSPFSITYLVNHNPNASAAVISASGSQVTLDASSSTHPDGIPLTYQWIDDPATPLGLNGMTGITASIPQPTISGEYYYYLVAKDSAGRADTLRSYFIIKKDGNYENPTYASNPQWAKQARVYFLFPKSFTSAGTIPAATARLDYVQKMGFNVIWVMPVMKNAYPIDQHYGPGYNIVDFYNVAPEYGTNQDFKNFVSAAHALGLKVILDVTPNHTSRFHPWSVDAHAFKQDSRYWTWYEHSNQPDNQTNGLGSSLDADGFNYYSGFSDQLLNYNWKDIDARNEMINVYKYWIKDFGIDGYRFDVYWGPHRRYGEQYMGMAVRTALKHIKPDILLLGEDDGTGSGTEAIYADYTNGNIHGGLDAAYDFKLYFNQIRNFGFSSGAITNLHNEINNGGFYPGTNSLYMRFMESQDEDCITYFYSNSNVLDATTTFNKTKPMATAIFSVPGFPMIWNGQEVGWGYGISGAKEARNRSTISWDFQGKSILTPHYQRLAWIRGTFPAFATQSFERIETGNADVYGIVRKYQNENAISLCNFANTSGSVSLTLTATGTQNVLLPNPQDGKTYYVNDVYNDSTYQITLTNGAANFSMTIPAYGSAVLIVSDSVRTVSVPSLTAVKTMSNVSLPAEYSLSQNYPNPFNPSTQIQFAIPASGFVTLKVYDMLGREVAVLLNEQMNAGFHSAVWNARGVSSGIYFYSLHAGTFIDTKRMVLLK